ncbi:hypothetical protein TraAM80_03948 [Trypanosoma rangeli]|uniref:Uncharacterized protein n=1 Tax=Trypanosoma rangeli TaxID=5698 RepID=A0A422NLN5_TRYRA|nr:uncharacterized protein TraAM80_03948 [Trypanosoma rangeli]RNF06375.1 hypothetical protein TraAM80_03948 [Trypanosoma rangeli]|eukprot:RNF06375.1 hypothetical protein TraAM80_03948 [Trypanosoma rangeli]
MSRVQARTTLLPNGQLEFSVWSTAGSDEDVSAVIFSLRSTHPSHFALVGSVLPDGVLLPGEKRTLLLNVLSGSARRDCDICLPEDSSSSRARLSEIAESSFGERQSYTAAELQTKTQDLHGQVELSTVTSGARTGDIHLVGTPNGGATTNAALLPDDNSSMLRRQAGGSLPYASHSLSDKFVSSHESSVITSTRRCSEELSDIDSSSHTQFVVSIQNTTHHNFLQSPYFFVYYGQLGNGDAYVNIALKWIKREQEKYIQGRKKALKHLQESGKSYDYLPPLLGNPVRWLKNMDGSIIRSCSFQLYQQPYSKSSARMFARRRHGNGCVIVPWRPQHGDGTPSKEIKEASAGEIIKVSPVTSSCGGARGGAGRQCGSEHLVERPDRNGNGLSPILSIASPGASTVSYPPPSKINDDAKVSSPEGVGLQPPELEGRVSSDLPAFVKMKSFTGCHVRTETEATVDMLDHTVCCDETFLEKLHRGKEEDKVSRSSNAELVASSVSKIPESMASAAVRVKDAVRVSPVCSSMLEHMGKRMLPHRLQASGHCRERVLRPQNPSSGTRNGYSSLPRNVAPSSREMTILELGDALCTIVMRSVPLLQTAISGTVSTVAMTVQLLWGLIEDSIDIIYVVCISVLSVFSFFLLWSAFGPTEGEDGTVKVMNLFA